MAGNEQDEPWTIITDGGAYEFRGDIFAEMARQEDLANDKVTDAQRIIGTEGHHWWMRLDHSFLIVGHVPTIDQTIAAERAYFPKDKADWNEEQTEEYESIIAGMYERWGRGYRFGRAYSEVEPRGELGDTHIVEMIEITEAEFDVAQRCGFVMSRIVAVAQDGDEEALKFIQHMIEETIER